MKFADLFAGAGGFSYGLKRAGFTPELAIEKDESACKTYRNNIDKNCLSEDLTSVVPKDFDLDVDLIAGGPPCQDFSVANYYSRGGEKTNLVFVFQDWIEYFKPKYFIMENVPGIKSVDNVFDRLVSGFEDMGYIVSHNKCNASNFGVPQKRERIFIVGCMNEIYNFPTVNRRKVTVSEAFFDLPSPNFEDDTGYLNHERPSHREETVEKFSEIKNGEPVYDSWSEKIRLNPDELSPTLKAGQRSTFHFLHPYEDRGLTVRERARLQSFPDWFEFFGSVTEQRKQTGNAVPPEMARFIGEQIKNTNKKTSVFDY